MHCAQHICLSSSIYLIFFYSLFIQLNFYLRITKVYESETYDYPVQIQESLSEISSSIGYNITSFAATNLKGTNLPVPAAPTAPPAAPHKTLPHALVRAAHTAATTVSTTAPSAETDRLGKALGLYAQGWERVAGARLDQDANIADNFLHPWQTTLNTSIAVALKARQAVKLSRLELDAAKQSYVVSLSFGVVLIKGVLTGLRTRTLSSRSK